VSPVVVTSTVSRLSAELIRLHSNNISVVPQIGRSKKPFPMRAPCPHCPDWRETSEWDEKKGRYRRIPPQRAHALDQAKEARRAAKAAGKSEPEAKRAYADTLERALRDHDVPDRRELWEWHVRGNGPTGKWYHRGVYSHRDHESGRDVCWDIDKGQDPFGKARVLRDKLRELGLGHAVYENTSFSGNGVHVRLCHENAPSWLRYAFGRALLVACGYTPGNDPAKGQTESFPKQDRANYVGNMIGLPCSIPRMAEGATCVLDENLAAVRDAAWAADRLAEVRRATLAELHAAARAIGLDPTKKPEPPKPKAKPGQPRAVRLPKGRGTVTYASGQDRLREEVRSRVDMTDLLVQLGVDHKGGDKYCCPIHMEPEDGNPSFHVYTATKAGSVHDRYQCFGDCSGTQHENGDVISLYAATKRMSHRDATREMARQLGLDPRDYLDQVSVKRPAGEKPSYKPLDRVAEWCARTVGATGKPIFAAKAVMRVLFQAGIGYDRVAPTLWQGMGKRSGWRRRECFANAAEALDALQGGEVRAGSSWLRRKLGLIEVRELAWAIHRDTKLPLLDLYKLCIGFERYWNGSDGRNFLRQTYLRIPDPVKKSRKRWQPPPEYEPPPESKVKSMIRRPTVCGAFSNVARDSLDGHQVAKLKLTCDVDCVCVSCFMTKGLGANDLVTGLVKPSAGDEGETDNQWNWAQRGPFYGVSVEFPLGFEQKYTPAPPPPIVTPPGVTPYKGVIEPPKEVDPIAKFKETVNRIGVSKLTAVSCNPITGARRILFLVADEISASRLQAQARVAVALLGAEEGTKITAQSTTDHVRAAGWVFNAGMDIVLHANLLAQRGDRDGIIAWCSWWKGKHKVISRSSKALPWPPREVVRKALKGEDSSLEEEYPGQVLRWDVVHDETGYVLATGLEHPATIDRAATIAGRDEEFGAFQVARQDAEKTALA
jgi:TOTE conflict system primase-like protein/CHC2-type zinc finger protein